MSPSPPFPPSTSANDRFKRGWSSRLWSSILSAVGLHFAVFLLWPTMAIADTSIDSEEVETVRIAEVELPETPEEVRPPAKPVVSDVAVSEEITMPSSDWHAWDPVDLTPPPGAGRKEANAAPAFVPYEVPPTIRNAAEVQAALEREYPSFLRDSGIGGTVRVRFEIDAAGNVIDRSVESSSGYRQFDEAALDVADVMRFTPALNRDQAVAVWVVFAITFQVR